MSNWPCWSSITRTHLVSRGIRTMNRLQFIQALLEALVTQLLTAGGAGWLHSLDHRLFKVCSLESVDCNWRGENDLLGRRRTLRRTLNWSKSQTRYGVENHFVTCKRKHWFFPQLTFSKLLFHSTPKKKGLYRKTGWVSGPSWATVLANRWRRRALKVPPAATVSYWGPS